MFRILIGCLLISHLSYAQVILKGTVVNNENNQPIAYCNIGIIGTDVGTISNYDGSFEITVPKKHEAEPLIFSALGHERVTINFNGSNENLTIKLEEKATMLKSIDVYASKKEKKAWFGNRKKDLLPSGSLNYDSASAGGAMALLIVKEDTALNFIKEARLRILRNTLPEFKVRVRFLAVDRSNKNLPGEDIFGESVVVTSSIRKGWLTFDLSERNIFIEQDSFYLEFEWLYEASDRYYVAQSYSDFIKNNPEKVVRDTVTIDNDTIIDVNVKNYIVGTFFAVTVSEAAKEAYITYDRSSSFAPWIRSTSILQAKVLLTD